MRAFSFSNYQNFNSAEEIVKKLNPEYQKDVTELTIFIDGDMYIDMISMYLDDSKIPYVMGQSSSQ